jgi:gephyrin
MVEDTRLIDTFDGEDAEERKVETLTQVLAGENVRSPGSDIKKGDLALQMGEMIRSSGGEIGTLAFVGRTEVSHQRTSINCSLTVMR